MRFKGLGEMMPRAAQGDDARPAAPRARCKVTVPDDLETERTLTELMGKDASARFRFIMERAREADSLDV